MEIRGDKMLPKKKLGRKFIILGLLFFPVLISFYIVSLNSNKLVPEQLSLVLLILASFSFVMLITGIIFYFTGKDTLKKKFKNSVKMRR